MPLSANPSEPASNDAEVIAPNPNRAHMLIALLGQDFTKSSEHPFFAKLNAMTAASDAQPRPVPKAALEKLLAALPKPDPAGKPATGTKDNNLSSKSKPRAQNLAHLSPTLRNLKDQHPAVIAHYLAHNSDIEKSEVIASLSGVTARQTAVYFTRIMAKIPQKP